MPGFIFEFEAVLRQRVMHERTRQLAVAKLEGSRVMLETEIRAMQAALSGERIDLRDQLATGAVVNLAAVKMQTHAAFRLTAKMQQYALGLSGVHHKLAQARQHLRTAAADRKAMETVKAARHAAWVQALARAENIELDEISTMRAARRELETLR